MGRRNHVDGRLDLGPAAGNASYDAALKRGMRATPNPETQGECAEGQRVEGATAQADTDPPWHEIVPGEVRNRGVWSLRPLVCGGWTSWRALS